MDRGPTLFLITGIMAAGKSTTAQALAERFDRSAHVRGDTFRRFVVSGRSEMSSSPSDEAIEQLRLRYRLAAACADSYVASGFATVMQDVILGPMLPEVVAMFQTRPVAVVVLAPSAREVERREAQRSKIGYTTFTPLDMHNALQERTPRLGLRIDTTEMSVQQTVDDILERQDEAIVN